MNLKPLQGYYCNKGLRHECQEGYYCHVQDLGSPKMCDAGYYCPSVKEYQIICDRGYHSEGGKTECTKCEEGTMVSSK